MTEESSTNGHRAGGTAATNQIVRPRRRRRGPDDGEDAGRQASTATLAGGILVDEEVATPPVPNALDADVLDADPGAALDDDNLLDTEALSLRQVLARGGVSTVGVLFFLNLVDEFDRIAYAILAPDIQRSLGISDVVLAAGGALGGFMVFIAAIPIGYLADRTRRVSLLGVLSALWAGCALFTGMVQNGAQLMLARVATGIGKANEGPVQKALLADAYPIAGRSRIYAVHAAANPIGHLIAPLAAGAIAAAAGGVAGWRWAFIVLALPAIVFAVLAFFLREPIRGCNERMAVFGDAPPVDDDMPISLSAGFARLKQIRTFKAFLLALGVLGFGFVSAPIFLNLILEKQYGLDTWGRAVVDTIVAAGGVVGMAVGGRLGDRVFRHSPEKAVVMIGVAIGLFGVALPVAVFMPTVQGFIAVQLVVTALTAGVFVPTSSIIAAVTPVRLRSLGFATVGIYLTLVGGVGGALIAGALSDAFGEQAAILLTMPPSAALGGLLIAYGAKHVRGDMAATVADLRIEHEEARLASQADEAPLLQVQHVDFSYGHVQVLFDVSVEVRRGEVLALLGTNGAGKSTLLRVVSGLAMPQRGIVRYDGRNISYVDPSKRVGLGLVQVPGGRAIFPGLTVQENLLLGAHTFIWDHDQVQSRVDRVVELFPVLGKRLGQRAGTLSGGEQQMVALARGMILDPQLLLIDELSLGLAPVVVRELLDTVERLKDAGVTMVIVEQSVNVALALADRAVFMEKGRIRFEGQASELLERDDLVRAVFLGRDEG